MILPYYGTISSMKYKAFPTHHKYTGSMNKMVYTMSCITIILTTGALLGVGSDVHIDDNQIMASSFTERHYFYDDFYYTYYGRINFTGLQH